MYCGKKVIVVMPAYNAEKTLLATVTEPPECVDFRILVDDGSADRTAQLGRELGLNVYVHDRNYGYGRDLGNCPRDSTPTLSMHPAGESATRRTDRAGRYGRVKERVREARVGNRLYSSLFDCRFRIRRLRHSPRTESWHFPIWHAFSCH